MRLATLFAAAACSLTLLGAPASAGVLVASGDEWQLSTAAYQGEYAAGTQGFVKSLANTFGGTNYLFLTGNTNMPLSQLGDAAAQLASLGKTVSYSTGFDPVAAEAYDAVFHFGQLIDPALLAAYVNGGGNAYISLGAGWYGSAAGEAAAWNPTLATFGLVAGSTWFPGAGFVQATVTSGPAEATSLIWGYGQSIEKLSPAASSQSYIRGSFAGGPTDIGLIGASVTLAAPGAAPEPSTWALLILGFGAVGAIGRRRCAHAA
ncbi:PEPxxWA-CTERM sorting domain-containing protein [Phenylobacterium sp.]|uniref:PEPxxWA-CTERM sorting domain-containing protein n=1 Tax=Phenylobacterium sp. TaxID=1871053 RepID=UPI0025DD8ECA|nr:PEPxxWA-CTERM sorting domain-containing protein [Phenylobacterium sp.]